MQHIKRVVLVAHSVKYVLMVYTQYLTWSHVQIGRREILHIIFLFCASSDMMRDAYFMLITCSHSSTFMWLLKRVMYARACTHEYVRIGERLRVNILCAKFDGSLNFWVLWQKNEYVRIAQVFESPFLDHRH